MLAESALLAALAASPTDPAPRLAYLDWLEARDDLRTAYFRAEDQLRTTPLGDPARQALGQVWRAVRAAQDPAWLTLVEPVAPVAAWVPTEARQPPHLGMEDWDQWASPSLDSSTMITTRSRSDRKTNAGRPPLAPSRSLVLLTYGLCSWPG